MPNNLEFYINFGGKFPYIPRRDQLGKSIFISTPNDHYDDVRGQRIIEDFLGNFAQAEKLGYDGAVILEQHSGPNAIAGQSIVMAAAAISRTTNMRIGTVGAILNSYLTPMRYAEEIATLDILSNGRYFFGLPMGIGANYHGLGMMNPTYARERFREAHDFLKRAFTEDGPFKFDGKFFNAEYVNLWPKPLQKPYPEAWVPAAGSKESLAFAAQNGYSYLAVLVPWPILLKNCRTFREQVEEAGQEWDPRRIVSTPHVYVAETDRQARKEAEAHVMSLLQNSLGSPFHDSFPPGHVTEGSLRGMAAGGGYRSKDVSETTYEDALESGQFIVGSPDTVAERLEEITTEMDAGRVCITGDTWTMPSWMTTKNMTLFAEEVMPRFRPAGGRPIWDRTERAGYRTVSEYGAIAGEPKFIPQSIIEGVGAVDIRTAHVDELRVPIEEAGRVESS
ncbi:LLM class flavin-dependent oxidoreductase [Pseudoclavibacter endophyticus]|nr:LLM class flavin-dependent oxidoreductase [Pseudoclavibacter endophyticus]